MIFAVQYALFFNFSLKVEQKTVGKKKRKAVFEEIFCKRSLKGV